MKKIFVLLTLGIGILMVSTSCNELKKMVAAPIPVVPHISDTISFKEHYVSKAGTDLIFTNAQARSLYLLNENPISLTGKIFDENLEVRNGKAYVKSTAVADLMHISALSVWNVDTSKYAFQRGTKSQALLSMKLNCMKNNAKYNFSAYVNADGTFSVGLEAGQMIYNNIVYPVQMTSQTQMLYSMTDTVSVKK